MKLDIARVEETRSLLGEETFVRFLRRLEGELDAFIAWLDADPAPTTEEIGLRCHTLASSAGLYGAKDLRVALLAAEQAANSGNPAELSAITNGLAAIWAETQQDFRELV